MDVPVSLTLCRQSKPHLFWTTPHLKEFIHHVVLPNFIHRVLWLLEPPLILPLNLSSSVLYLFFSYFALEAKADLSICRWLRFALSIPDPA